MNMEYTTPSLAQGRLNQSKAAERPNTFSTENGVDQIQQGGRLDIPKQRMAGQMGNRVLEYMNDPDEQERTDAWMEMFELSNEGKEFNQAKIGGAPGAE